MSYKKIIVLNLFIKKKLKYLFYILFEFPISIIDSFFLTLIFIIILQSFLQRLLDFLFCFLQIW